MNILFEDEKNIRLQRLSTLSVAIYVWDLPDIKERTEIFFSNFFNHKGYALKNSVIEKWLEIYMCVLKKLDILIQDLPKVLKEKVEDVVAEIGEKIFDWRYYLTDSLRLNIRHSRQIHWTTNGAVDENKSFPVIWNSIDPYDKFLVHYFCGRGLNDFIPLLTPMYRLACIHVQEKWILDFQESFIQAFERYHQHMLKLDMTDVVFSIMTVVLGSFYFNNRILMYQYLVSENGFIILSPEKMLDISIELYLYKPVVYFWNKMTPDEQLRYLQKLSERELRHSQVKFKSSYYETRNLPDILAFFISKMNDTQKYHFVLKNFPFIFLALLKRWSSHKFCIVLLDQFWNVLTKKDFEKILFAIVFDGRHCFPPNIKNRLEMYFILPILDLLLKKLPKNIKERAFLLTPIDNNFLLNLKIGDLFSDPYIPVLLLIINDKDFKEYRYEIFGKGEYEFNQLILKKNYKLLDELFEKDFPVETEGDDYKEKYKFLNEWIKNGNFDLVERFLDWISNGNPEKRDMIKSQINFNDTDVDK